MKELEQVFVIEIQRLYLKVQEGPLDNDDTNKLVKLTSALKNYQSAPIDEANEDISKEYTKEELLLLARQDIPDED